MRIEIDSIAYGGYGIGRIDGKAVFVDYALPGDVLDVIIYDDRKNFSFACIREIISPSPKRIEPSCPNFSKCGGCSYLNVDYKNEIEFKKTILKDQLRRIALLDSVPEINIVTAGRYHYRSHSSIKIKGGEAGFYGRNSNSIVPFPGTGCMLISENLVNGLKHLPVTGITGDLRIAEDWRGNFFCGVTDCTELDEKTGEFIFRRDINGFFQSNRFLREKMTDLVLEFSSLKPDDEFADICSGCGFFTVPLSNISRKGTGFDIDRRSIESAKKNAVLNNRSNINFFALPESEINPSRISPKTVIIDPPRSGISKRGRRTINAINPEVIVYVSCNPSTYSRDAADFYKNGYIIEELTLIDMFPCTHHIEVVSRLVKSQI